MVRTKLKKQQREKIKKNSKGSHLWKYVWCNFACCDMRKYFAHLWNKVRGSRCCLKLNYAWKFSSATPSALKYYQGLGVLHAWCMIYSRKLRAAAAQLWCALRIFTTVHSLLPRSDPLVYFHSMYIKPGQYFQKRFMVWNFAILITKMQY